MGDIIARLKQEIRQIYFDKPKIDSLIHTMQDRFGIPSGDAMDYIEERKKLEDASRFRHYAFAFAFDKLNDTDITKEFFTQVERSVMAKEREAEEAFEFPIRIDCYPVTAQQWIGVSSVKFLMSLRDAQLINYNANTQRVMKRIIHNKSSSYRIAVNERAVKEIEKSFERGEFIPNTITINIPDTETDFYYDTKAHQLIINSIDHFDMTDGYHRYLAMSRLSSKTDFDYPIELRIQNFPEYMATQFIYQEDKKTRMARVDAEGLNKFDPCNQVVDRLNSMPACILSGMIRSGGGLINSADMASLVRYFYYDSTKNTSVAKQKAFVVKTTEYLCGRLNSVFGSDPALLEKDRITFKELMIIFVCLNKYADDNECNSHIKEALKRQDEIPSQGFASRKPRKGLVTLIGVIS